MLGTIRWLAAAQDCALLPVRSAGTDITSGIRVQPPGSTSTADHCVLVQKDISVCPTPRTWLHAAPRQVCFCFHPWQVFAFPPKSCSSRLPVLQNRGTKTDLVQQHLEQGAPKLDQGSCCTAGRRDLTGRETERLLALCKQAEQSENHCQHLQRDPGTQILLKCNSSGGEHFSCAQMN